MSSGGPLRGRVLVLAEEPSATSLIEKLSSRGFFCAFADAPDRVLSIAEQLRPEAILVAGAGIAQRSALEAIQQNADWAQLPVLADFTGGQSEAIRRLQFKFDDRVHSEDELTPRLEAALRAKRLIDRDVRVQLRMEMLLEITQAATSSLELGEILQIAIDKVSRVVANDRCSVVLVEGSSPRQAQVVASRERPDLSSLLIDLLRYPELRKALETRQAVYIEDATRDPLMRDVRQRIAPLGVKSILVQPLICQEDLLGALFLRLSRADGSFGREEQEFARAAAAALANSVRNSRLHTALKRKREDLESAYVDRYRELTDANRRLKELNRVKDDIIAVVSHDLRAPLQVLLGHGRLLLDGELPLQQRSSIQAIVRQGKKILELVESLLERGKGDLASFSLDPTIVDVAEMCKEATNELEILAADKGVALRAETPESLLVIGDEVKIRQVLQNLITNAVNHARASGSVVVHSQRLKRPDGDAARIVIQDDGPGIAADQLQLVFDRYRHGPGGIGLGLAICKEFVDLHGGEIWAENSDQGGCSFIFTLPLAKTPQGKVGPPAATVGPSAGLARVLVVEDEPEVAAVVSEILRSRYRVEVARDGAEGVAKARGLHPDLIVMDVFLPKLDGLDAAVALQSSSDTADIPIILLSAHRGVAEKVRALNLGAVDYISKPFQALELLARADRAMQLKATEQELKRSKALLRQSGNDPETGLFDRAGVLHRMEHELSRSLRYKRPLSLAVLVPDRPLDDKVRDCAILIRSRMRAPDFLGHLGRGVFAMVLPESQSAAAGAISSRIGTELCETTGVAFRSAAADVLRNGPKPDQILKQLLGEE